MSILSLAREVDLHEILNKSEGLISIVEGHWSSRNINAVCLSGFSAMLDLSMGGFASCTNVNFSLLCAYMSNMSKLSIF